MRHVTSASRPHRAGSGGGGRADREPVVGLPTPFAEAVLDLVEQIPSGRVMAYGDVAAVLGSGGAREVGTVMARFGSGVPWHRVVRSDGSPPDRSRGRGAAPAAPRGHAAARGHEVDIAAARWWPEAEQPPHPRRACRGMSVVRDGICPVTTDAVPLPPRLRHAAPDTTGRTPPALLLDRTPPLALDAPPLDEDQRRVVAHRGGPLLVLAGPGTGKTTTLVEAVVAGVEARAADPTRSWSSRSAARRRRSCATGSRPGSGARPVPTAWPPSTPSAYALVRAHQDPRTSASPLRLLSGPEQDVAVRELLAGAPSATAGCDWPPTCAPASTHPRLRRRGPGGARPRPASSASTRTTWTRSAARRAAAPTGRRGGRVPRRVPRRARPRGRARLRRAGPPRRAARRRPARSPRALRGAYRAVFVDEYQDTDPAQVRLLQALAGDGRDLVVVGDPDQSIYAFRGRRGARHPRLPATASRRADGAPAPVVVLRHDPAVRARPAGRQPRAVARGMPLPAACRARRCATHRDPVPRVRPRRGRVEVLTFDAARRRGRRTSPTCCAARTSSDGMPWARDGRAGPLRPAVHPAAAPRAGRRRACRSRSPATSCRWPASPRSRRCCTALRAAADPDGRSTRRGRRATLLLSPLGGARPGRAAPARPRPARRGAREPAAPPGHPSAGCRGAADPGCCSRTCPSRSPAGPTRVAARRPRRLARLLPRPATSVAAAGTAEEALWALWRGTPAGRTACSARAARAAARPAAAPTATSTPSSRCSTSAAATEERSPGGAGVPDFLAEVEAQQIPADTLAERGVRGDGRAAAHRPPQQGPGVGGRRRRRRPGGRVARPAPPRLAAARPSGSAAPGWSEPAAHRARCSPRSAGCSTSRAPGPGARSW